MKKKLISIIVPTRKLTPFLKNKLIPALKNQIYKNYELIIALGKSKPGKKRDKAAKRAKGEILAFIDDDVYPHKNWLKKALPYFKNKKIAAVCGPALTPKESNLREKVSGFILSSWLGAGGAGTYRNCQKEKRRVDDYPTFNLLVRKADFWKIKGFNTDFWPGEDTKLCHDLVYKLKKKIIYDPEIFVYHQRRPLFLPFLKQISRYGQQRGYFIKLYPKSSLKLGYFLPSIFLIYLLGGTLIFVFSPQWRYFYFSFFVTYLLLLLISAWQVYRKEKNFSMILIFILGIILTHLVYGGSFLYGLAGKPKLLKPRFASSS